MAWNESFTAGEGWAAPETSFSTGPSKDSQSSKLYEKFTCPVTISNICDKMNVEEKYNLGDYSFSNIITVGIVQEMTEENDTISYVLYDPEDKSKTIKASQYMGTDGETSEVRRYFEEERVQVVGKARSFAGNLDIMAFGFRDSSEDHYKAFQLEAKIAALYFTKNVPEMLRNGPVPSLSGCAAGVPQNDSAMQGLSSAMNKGQPNTQRLYGNTTSTPAAGGATVNGLTGSSAAVLQLLDQGRVALGETGMATDEMKRRLPKYSMDDIRNACNFLVAEGHAYVTIDDDHLAII